MPVHACTHTVFCTGSGNAAVLSSALLCRRLQKTLAVGMYRTVPVLSSSTRVTMGLRDRVF